MSHSRSWMFCPRSGCLLEKDYVQQALVSKESGYRCSFSELQDVSVVLVTDMKDWRRKHNIRPLASDDPDVVGAQPEEAATRARATVDEVCPKCQHRGMEYYTMQLRSADEGQTVFYECLECGHKFSQNT